MKVRATDMKNYFGKYLKKCEEEDIFITKNERIIAKLSKYDDPSDGYLMIKEGSAAYTYSGKRVTYEEFLKITEGNEERYEYIDGEVFLLSSPGVKHQIILSNMMMSLLNWFDGKKCRVFAAPFDVTLWGEEIDSKNVVQPDILISCDYNEQRNERDRYTGIPALVVEILSPQTRSRDHIKKLKVYVDGGIGEYWIVDPKEMKVVQYHFVEKELVEMITYSNSEVLKSIHFKGLELALDDIFKE
jgi:Uma2 family endonuclease